MDPDFQGEVCLSHVGSTTIKRGASLCAPQGGAAPCHGEHRGDWGGHHPQPPPNPRSYLHPIIPFLFCQELCGKPSGHFGSTRCWMVVVGGREGGLHIPSPPRTGVTGQPSPTSGAGSAAASAAAALQR